MTVGDMAKNKAAGFSLVELLVALFIFALIAAASVSVLGMSMTSKDVVDARAARLSELETARALLKADFAQTVPRTSRDDAGFSQNPYFGGGPQGTGQVIFAFVRKAWVNPLEETSPSLQYVEYALEEERLIRRARARVDAAPDTPVRERAVLTGVSDVAVSFLSKGVWSDRWVQPPNMITPVLLPVVAVEMDIEGIGSVRQLFRTSEANQ